MSKKDLLLASRARISDPNRWTRGAIARLKDGTICEPDNLEAARFCFIGALYRDRLAFGIGYAMVKALILDLERTAEELYPEQVCTECSTKRCLAHINDDIGYEAVMTVIDAQITKYTPSATIIPFKRRAPADLEYCADLPPPAEVAA